MTRPAATANLAPGRHAPQAVNHARKDEAEPKNNLDRHRASRLGCGWSLDAAGRAVHRLPFAARQHLVGQENKERYQEPLAKIKATHSELPIVGRCNYVTLH